MSDSMEFSLGVALGVTLGVDFAPCRDAGDAPFRRLMPAERAGAARCPRGALGRFPTILAQLSDPQSDFARLMHDIAECLEVIGECGVADWEISVDDLRLSPQGRRQIAVIATVMMADALHRTRLQSLPAISVSITETGGELCIRVCDNGAPVRSSGGPSLSKLRRLLLAMGAIVQRVEACAGSCDQSVEFLLHESPAHGTCGAQT